MSPTKRSYLVLQAHSGNSFGGVPRLRESFSKTRADMWLWTVEWVSLDQLNAKTSWSSFPWDWALASPTNVSQKVGPFMAIILLLLCGYVREQKGFVGLSLDLWRQHPQWKVINHPLGSKKKNGWGGMAYNTWGSVCMVICVACETGFIL